MNLAAAFGGHREQAKPRRTTAAPQRTLLVAAHTDRGALDDHARQALAAAALIADAQTEVVLLAFGEFNDDAAALGADKLIALPAVRPAQLRARGRTERARRVRRRVCAGACLPARQRNRRRRPRPPLRGAGNASVATHVVEIDAKHVAVYVQASKAYRGARAARSDPARAERRRSEAAVLGRGRARRSRSAWRHRQIRYRDLGIEEIDAAQVALEEADFIVSAGNGVGDVPAFERLAQTLGAAIGASRVAVDDGKFTRDKQIGATGKTVDASVYIAFGISGAVQHLQGIKDCRHVIAVNLDASAPIAKRANLTIIADAQETIAALTDAAAAARSARGTGAALLSTKPVAEGALA